MKRIKEILGPIILYAFYPVFYFYLRNTNRTRVIINCENEILLVKSFIGTNEFGLPGGGTHENELPREGAVREVREETGLILKPEKLKLLVENKRVSDKGFKFFINGYYLSIPKKLETKPQNTEILSTEWVDYKRALVNYRLDTQARDLIETWTKVTHLVD